jgi:toxin ParE1/3/4
VKIVWSPLAIERAYEEAQFIAADKPEAALRWLEKLFESTDRLEMFPESGSMVPEIALPDYRQIIYRSHRVIYRVEKTQVSILTVRSSRQLLQAAEIVQ